MAPRSLKRKGTRKPRFVLRAKDRPVGSHFEIEVRLKSVRDIPEAHRSGFHWITDAQRQEHVELYALLETVRRNVGSGFKIVQHHKRGMIETKIFLKREADLYFLIMAHQSMIHRAYRYRSTAPSDPAALGC